MTKKIIAGIIVVAGAALALLAGPHGPLGGFWRPVTDTKPAGWQLAGLTASGLVEAIGFGAALGVLAVGRPLFTRLTATPSTATAAQLTTVWLLGSWWPHSALHLHHGLKLSALAAIEPVFHAGSILAAGLLIWALISRPATTV